MVLGKQFKLKVTKRYKRDLDAVFYNIAHVCMNPLAANNLLMDLDKSIKKRLFSVESYELHTPPHCEYTYYRIYVGKYVVYYTVNNNVMVLRRFLLDKMDSSKHLY